jgi:hypothetical protein
MRCASRTLGGVGRTSMGTCRLAGQVAEAL